MALQPLRIADIFNLIHSGENLAIITKAGGSEEYLHLLKRRKLVAIQGTSLLLI